jgi:hypothetical protein
MRLSFGSWYQWRALERRASTTCAWRGSLPLDPVPSSVEIRVDMAVVEHASRMRNLCLSLHRQHNAKPRLPTHHARVGFPCFRQSCAPCHAFSGTLHPVALYFQQVVQWHLSVSMTRISLLYSLVTFFILLPLVGFGLPQANGAIEPFVEPTKRSTAPVPYRASSGPILPESARLAHP